MTEQEWLECNDAEAMVDWLDGNERKFRLFACACCRRIWHWFTDEEASREAVEIAERFADGGADGQELASANQMAGSMSYAYCATLADSSSGAFGTAHCIAEALSQSYPCEEVESAYLAESLEQSRLLRDIFGNPFRPLSINPVWLTPTVTNLAATAYEERALPSGELDNARLAVLADALEEVGYDNADILNHLRGPGPHVRGCWAVDLLLGKE